MIDLDPSDLRARHHVFSSEDAVDALAGVMADLADALREENELLRRGLPAGLSEVTPRKIELSDEYMGLMVLAQRHYAAEIAASPVLQRRLAKVAGELTALTDENMRRLEAAMSATRRRIEAVMTAIRGKAAKDRGYGADGAALMSRMVQHRSAYKA